MARPSKLWSPAAVEKMRQLRFDDRLTWQGIGDALGVPYTKQACIGKAMRLGWDTAALDVGPGEPIGDHCCSAPGCEKIIPRRAQEGLRKYLARKTCCPECAARLIAVSVKKLWDDDVRKRADPKASSPKRPGARKAKRRLPTGAVIDPAVVEAFIAAHGLTLCPTKCVAPSQHVALYGEAAERAIARVRVVDDAGWKTQRDARLRCLGPSNV